MFFTFLRACTRGGGPKQLRSPSPPRPTTATGRTTTRPPAIARTKVLP